MVMTPAAGNTTSGSIAAIPQGIGRVTHQAITQTNVARLTRPWYESGTGSSRISANRSGPAASFSSGATAGAAGACGFSGRVWVVTGAQC
jgi:hypothetical protein